MTIISNRIISRSNSHQVRSNRFPRVNTRFLGFPVLVLLGSLLLSALSISVNMTDWRISLNDNNLIKFTPLIAILLAAIIVIPALPAERIVPTLFGVLKVNWFLTSYTLLALLGSIYARFILKNETSYFTQAVMSLSFYCAYFIFSVVPDEYWPHIRHWTISAFWYAAIFAACTVVRNTVSYLIFKDEFQISNHDLAFLLVQSLVLAFCSYKGLKRFWIAGIITILIILTFKNTALVMLTVTGLLLVLLPSYIGPNRFILKLLGGILILGLIVTAYLFVRSFTSDGNISFRSDVYQYQFSRFLKSPYSIYFGYLFTTGTGTDWTPFLHSLNRHLVPTHNDWLDVLVQGGIIGFLFFLSAFVWLLYRLFATRRISIIQLDQAQTIATTWIILLVINHMITITFNPVLGATDITYIVWIAIAFGHRSLTSTNTLLTSNNYRQ